MPALQVAWNGAPDYIATVQNAGDALPAGAVLLQSFQHNDEEFDLIGEPADHNHVIFHHVRDILLQNIGHQNMQIVTIATIPLTGISVSPATAARTVGQTQQLVVTAEPANAFNEGVKFASSNPLIATVDAAGLITAVMAGTATITAQSDIGGFLDTCVITVT